MRGTVPGGTAAAAQIKYAGARKEDPRNVYYGRVIRRRGWIVLHYLYFYFMNDYRSTFHGVNDHEADWEQVLIYLEEGPHGVRPWWIAAAAHDYIGDQLRRRWDDPTLVLEGDHPVLFAGAGSHASYFEQGEYMTSAPDLGAARSDRAAWTRRDRCGSTGLRQPDPGDLGAKLEATLSASFIDYARGDGTPIGPGGDEAWSPMLISDADAGSTATAACSVSTPTTALAASAPGRAEVQPHPAQQRMTWHDPLGFAGLDKASPPDGVAGRAGTARAGAARTKASEVQAQDRRANRPAARTGARAPGARSRRRHVDSRRRAGRGLLPRASSSCAACGRTRPRSTTRSPPLAANGYASRTATSAIRAPI